ncbi:hypothetical protein B0F90DRAFT_1687333 [Multifurca ochricompacta]|uniref:BHLH domain-containing protein n=1 Tax=Multifurca ochricompacta TaxID=376703 RepID=A0AAD4QT73_9AGAM|nr:hypothetical protein B0F90DRAFT_1687333 [Multifurca ochricompacta]
MVEKEGKTTQSPFAQSDRPSSDVVQNHLNLRRSSGDSSPHKSPRRGSTTDSSLLSSPSLTSKIPHLTARPPFTSTDTDTGRDISQRPSQPHSRPSSPFKYSDRSSNSPDRLHTQSSSRRASLDVSEALNSAMHTARDPKHKPIQAGQSSSSHIQTEVTVTSINSQTPQRGPSSPSLPHGTKRKLSSDRNMPTPGGDEIDSQLIGPGVPSSINIGLEGPALKRRGSIAETQRVGQMNLFDRRHSVDARPTSVGPQWWSGDRRDSSSSMFPSPSVSYGSPAYSGDSSHGHPPPGTTPFAWHSTQSPDQSSTIQSEGDGSSSGRPFDPSSVPPIAMVPPVPFSAERRMSVPTNLPSTMSTNSTVSRVLRSRSRPPSAGRARAIEIAATTDSATSQTAADTDSGGTASASPSAAPPLSATKETGMTPYSRSPELRVSHKLAERKRRKEMKDLFDELRDQLPADRGMKASKWEILSKAIDFIMQLKQGHQDMSREIDILRHELESVRTGVPPFGSGGPHPGMYAPGPPGVVPYPPHPPAGPALPSHQPPSVLNHQPAPLPQSDSRPGSSQNAFNASPAPQGGGTGGASGTKPEAPSA